MDSNIERWYSMKEICEYLGVSREDVYKRQGVLSASVRSLSPMRLSGTVAVACAGAKYCK